MFPGVSRAATAALAGALLTLVFCGTAGAEATSTTAATSETTTALAPAPTSQPAPPMTVPARRIVLIGTADSVQSTAIQSVNVQPVRPEAVTRARELPHTGSASAALTLLGFALVLLGALALRGQQPQLRLSERS